MKKKDIDVLWQKALKASVEANEQFTRYRFAALLEEEFYKEDVLTTAYMTGFQAGRDYEAETNLNCKSVQKRLATSWGYVKQDDCVTALKVIHTWASVEGALDENNVLYLCNKALGSDK
jgi:hypothetical protein